MLWRHRNKGRRAAVAKTRAVVFVGCSEKASLRRCHLDKCRKEGVPETGNSGKGHWWPRELQVQGIDVEACLEGGSHGQVISWSEEAWSG